MCRFEPTFGAARLLKDSCSRLFVKRMHLPRIFRGKCIRFTNSREQESLRSLAAPKVGSKRHIFDDPFVAANFNDGVSRRNSSVYRGEIVEGANAVLQNAV